MTAIRHGTAACLRSFRLLAAALEGGDAAYRSLVDSSNLEDEYGRFRVWAGNLGAQQKGHSSLDYRLRDSPLLQSNVLKLLHELENNLEEARAVITGARLPYEQQAVSGDFSDDSASEDSEDDESSSEEGRPRFELQQRMFEIVDIVSNLYRLSIRIRSPTVRTRALKAATYRLVDPETGVDVFSQYAEFDKRYTEEALAHLRAERKHEDVVYLVERLSRAITRRRQQFKYWKKHRDKLSNTFESGDTTSHPVNDDMRPQHQAVMDTPDDPVRAMLSPEIHLKAPPSEDQPRTLLSGTEATAHHRTLDDAVDSQSVTSVATTARDLDGHGIELPPPPRCADGERDFECPYCFVICPARYGRMRSWKTHVLQDLQPYVCTYKDCAASDQMFRSRREWLDHESSTHRRVWRCPGHPDAVYCSEEGLINHLDSSHDGSLGGMQVQQMIRLAEVSTNDTRQRCPICLISVDDTGIAGNMNNHIANHLERLASFALPRFTDADEDKSGVSMHASDARRSSSERSEATSSRWSIDTASHPESAKQDTTHSTGGTGMTSNGTPDFQVSQEDQASILHGLSADAVESLPDASGEKMAQFIEYTRRSVLERVGEIQGEDNSDQHASNVFQIHPLDEPREGFREDLGPNNSGSANQSYRIRLYSLPKTMKERKEFSDYLSSLGASLRLGPNFESRGYAMFRSQEEAEHALTGFDRSRYPDVIFSYEKDGEEHMDGTVSAQDNVAVEFDAGAFLDLLSRTLSKPENAKYIAWAADGRTFCVTNEESFAQDILPEFRLESFALFRDRLLACGFRQQFGQQLRLDGEWARPTSIWYHKHFQRDRQELSGRLSFFAKLQRSFSNTKGRPLVSQLKTDIRTFSTKNPRSTFIVKVVSDMPTVSDLYLNGWLQNPSSAALDVYSKTSSEEINQKISMLQHDITMLDVDAIVNGTGPDLNTGASDSISYWIHEAAGPDLLKECKSLRSCQMGQAVMTSGYNLPCRKIIHTVRPHYFQASRSVKHDELLASCYRSCLKIAVEKRLKSIAFPCLSAGGYGFPGREAAEIALATTRAFLESGEGDKLQRIVFCVYKDIDVQFYRTLIPLFFPPTTSHLDSSKEQQISEESPESIDEDILSETPGKEEEDVLRMELGTTEPSKTRSSTWLSESVESLSRLTGGPPLWACCKCRARPMETPNCLVCYHDLCNTCEAEGSGVNTQSLSALPHLFLVFLQPSSSMLEESEQSGLSFLDGQDLISHEDQNKASVRSRPNSPARNYRPTYVKAHRKHLSLDTLFYYDLPFQFDDHDQDHIIITRELSEEQSAIIFEHSRRHRRNLPSLIRTRIHQNPRSNVLTIRIGSDASFNKQDRPPGAPIFLPEPFITADHCDFYIKDSSQWMLEINRGSGSTFLNGRRLVRLPAAPVDDGGAPPREEDDQQATPVLPPHDERGYFIQSGDILGLGENDNGKPVFLFRVEAGNVNGSEHELWEEAEARASRYGFPTIGLDEGRQDAFGGDPAGAVGDNSDSDLDDADVDDPEITSGYRIIDAPTAEGMKTTHIPEQARGAARWTRIERRLVNPDALKEAGLFFENRVNFMLVFRELSPGEVRRLAQRTRKSRAAKAETMFTQKERRRNQRRAKEQKKAARERKKGLVG